MAKTQAHNRWRLAGAVLAATAALTLSCKQADDGGNGAPAGTTAKKAPEATATRVEVAVLEGGAAADRLIRPGEVIGAREAHLAAALGGYVERVMVESGQEVKKHQVLARVDSSIHAAQFELTKVEVKDAKRELARLEELGKAVAGARVDAARTRLARATAQHRLTGTRLSRTSIRAPFAGVLVNLQIEQGEVAAPGQPIGRLLLLDPIRVSVSVSDRDVGTLKAGAVALVTSAGSPDPIAGHIARIEPAADLQTRTFLVEVELPNPERKLLPGMIASVAFRRQNRGEALLLPQELLVTRLDSNGVYVIDSESVARWRPLQLGQVVGDQVEILQGVGRGDRIVNVGHRSLSDGDPVIISRQGICCRDGRVVYDSARPAPPKKVKRAVEPGEPGWPGEPGEPGGASKTAATGQGSASVPGESKL